MLSLALNSQRGSSPLSQRTGSAEALQEMLMESTSALLTYDIQGLALEQLIHVNSLVSA